MAIVIVEQKTRNVDISNLMCYGHIIQLVLSVTGKIVINADKTLTEIFKLKSQRFHAPKIDGKTWIGVKLKPGKGW